jgi:hypothetical protein
MKRVTSLGGIFFKCKNPDLIKEWNGVLEYWSIGILELEALKESTSNFGILIKKGINDGTKL